MYGGSSCSSSWNHSHRSAMVGSEACGSASSASSSSLAQHRDVLRPGEQAASDVTGCASSRIGSRASCSTRIRLVLDSSRAGMKMPTSCRASSSCTELLRGRGQLLAQLGGELPRARRAAAGTDPRGPGRPAAAASAPTRPSGRLRVGLPGLRHRLPLVRRAGAVLVDEGSPMRARNAAASGSLALAQPLEETCGAGVERRGEGGGAP